MKISERGTRLYSDKTLVVEVDNKGYAALRPASYTPSELSEIGDFFKERAELLLGDQELSPTEAVGWAEEYVRTHRFHLISERQPAGLVLLLKAPAPIAGSDGLSPITKTVFYTVADVTNGIKVRELKQALRDAGFSS